MSSCKPIRTVQSEKRSDSVVIVETLRDTTIYLPGDESMVRALLECDSLGQVRLKELLQYKAGERLKPPELNIRNNVLSATAQMESMAIYLQLKERQKTHLSNQATVRTETIEVNRLTWWQQLWIRLGQILAAVTVLYIIVKLLKPYIHVNR